MARSRARSALKKAYKSVKGMARKRYVTKTGKGLRISQVVKDVAMLKSLVNAEKKHFTQKSTGTNISAVGQVNGNANGTWSMDLTPNMSQGLTASQRLGDSVKLHSSYLRFQFQKQLNANQPIKLNISVYKVNGQPFTNIVTAYSTIFKPNDFISTPALYDYQSLRDTDYFKNFTLIRSKNVYMKESDFAGEPMIQDVSIPIRYKNHHIKWDNITNTPSQGQLVIVIRADNGNYSGATVSTVSGIPITNINTAVNFGYVFEHFYYDN